MPKSNIPKSVLYIIIGSTLFLVLAFGLGIYTFLKNKDTTSFFKQVKNYDSSFDNSKDRIEYQKVMTEYISMCDMALRIFPVDTTLIGREKSMSDIKNIGIYYWERNLEILQGLDQLNLPEKLKVRNELCKEYCKLQKNCYELMYKAIDEHTKVYDSQINAEMDRVKQKMAQIKAN